MIFVLSTFDKPLDCRHIIATASLVHMPWVHLHGMMLAQYCFIIESVRPVGRSSMC